MARTTLTSGKDYVKWEKPGQVVEGTLRKIELSRGSTGGKMLHLVDAEGRPFMVSAPTLLAELIEENFDSLAEKYLTITYTAQDKPGKRGQSGLMRFNVDFDDDE